MGAALKLACPASVGGRVVSILYRTGGGGIQYQVAGSGIPGLPWPPDPAWTEYGERCQCETCGGRLVGATVDELYAVVNGIHAGTAVNWDTYFLRYLESARDVIVREAQSLRYGIHRDISTFTDTYVRDDRRVAVRYDDSSQEVKEVRVVLRRSDESHPATIPQAVAALRGP